MRRHSKEPILPIRGRSQAIRCRMEDFEGCDHDFHRNVNKQGL